VGSSHCVGEPRFKWNEALHIGGALVLVRLNPHSHEFELGIFILDLLRIYCLPYAFSSRYRLFESWLIRARFVTTLGCFEPRRPCQRAQTLATRPESWTKRPPDRLASKRKKSGRQCPRHLMGRIHWKSRLRPKTPFSPLTTST